jgi:hypothetical protein
MYTFYCTSNFLKVKNREVSLHKTFLIYTVSSDERVPGGESDSFHASMWDEERHRKQQIHFDFAYGSDEEVWLSINLIQL